MTIALTVSASYLAIGVAAAAVFWKLTLKALAKGERTSDADIRIVAACIVIGWLPLMLLTAYFMLTWKDESDTNLARAALRASRDCTTLS